MSLINNIGQAGWLDGWHFWSLDRNADVFIAAWPSIFSHVLNPATNLTHRPVSVNVSVSYLFVSVSVCPVWHVYSFFLTRSWVINFISRQVNVLLTRQGSTTTPTPTLKLSLLYNQIPSSFSAAAVASTRGAAPHTHGHIYSFIYRYAYV